MIWQENTFQIFFKKIKDGHYSEKFLMDLENPPTVILGILYLIASTYYLGILLRFTCEFIRALGHFSDNNFWSFFVSQNFQNYQNFFEHLEIFNNAECINKWVAIFWRLSVEILKWNCQPVRKGILEEIIMENSKKNTEKLSEKNIFC